MVEVTCPTTAARQGSMFSQNKIAAPTRQQQQQQKQPELETSTISASASASASSSIDSSRSSAENEDNSPFIPSFLFQLETTANNQLSHKHNSNTNTKNNLDTMSFHALQQRQKQLDQLLLNCEIVCRSSDDGDDADQGKVAAAIAEEEEDDHVDQQTVQSQKSWWADISEVNSQQTMKSENLSDMEKQLMDEGDEDDDEEDRRWAQAKGGGLDATPKVANGILKPSSTAGIVPRRLVDSPKDAAASEKAAEEVDYYQPSGESACEDDCSSLLSSSIISEQSSRIPADVLVKKAQGQVIEAQHELAAVEARIVSLQSQHGQEIQQLEKQVSTSKVVEKELTARLQSQTETLYEIEDQLTETQKEKVDLHDRVVELTDKVEQQNKQLIEQAKAHGQNDLQYNQTIQSLEEQVQSLQEDKDRAEQKLKDAQETLERLEVQLADALVEASSVSPSKSVRIAEEQNVVVHYNESDYVSRIHQSQEETRMMEERLLHVKGTLSELRDEHNQLKKTHDNVCRKHAVELEQERSSKNSSQTQIKSLLEELVRLQDLEKQLSSDRDSLHQQLNDARRSQEATKERLLSKEQESSLLELELIRVKDTVQALRQESNHMMAMAQQQSVPSPPSYYAQTNVHEETALQLRKEADRLAQELVGMQSKLESDAKSAEQERQALLEELQVANDRLEVAHRRLSQMEMEKKELQQQLLQLQDVVTELKKERDQLVAEKASMQESHAKELAEQRHLVDTAKTHAAKLQREMSDMELVNGHFQQQKAELETDLKTMQAKYEELQAEHTRSSSQNDAASTALEEQKILVAAANATIKALQRERDGLRQEIVDLKQSQDALEAKLHETEQLWRDAVNQVRMKQKGLIALQDKLAKSKDDKSVLEKELSTRKKSSSSRIKRIGRAVGRRAPADSSESKRVKEEVAALQRDIEEIEAKCYGLKTELVASNELVAKLERDLEHGRRELESERTTNKEALQSKMDALRSAEEDLKSLRIQLEESQKEQTRYANSIEKLEETVEELVSKTVSGDSHLAELHVKLAAALKGQDELEEELRAVTAEAQSYKEEKDQSALAALSLKTTNDELTAKIDAQSAKIKKLAKFIARTLERQNGSSADEDEDDDDTDIPNRVSGMIMDVTFTYNDKISDAPSTMSQKAAYTGPVLDGQAHGPGMLRFTGSGDLYIGSFDRGSIIKGVGSFIRRRHQQDKNLQGRSDEQEQDNESYPSKSVVQTLMNNSSTTAMMVCG
eukprot:CAMPEP_0113481486 /NCGR_PEP_ID=MMETSP0014_2-20120614/22434_1 /TAXON_ID=2857 /ORGANISM="Nitzschia sp." /LENGTH=1244 /DNA_ID=CAMNT_0000374985 /DNA_START=247 /DNA_END=3981 /DNA_ORIENTATION=+ /assembly_acc=CAM_ASM_000159